MLHNYASLRRHVMQDIHKGAKTQVRDLASPQRFHALEVQGLQTDGVVRGTEIMRQLPVKGMAHIGNPLVHTSEMLFGQWACEQGYKRIAAIGADYAFGYEVVGGFQKSFEDCGGKIIQKLWVPIGAKDLGPYLPQLKTDADAVFAMIVGALTVQFPKQYKAAGLTMPLIGGGPSADEFVLPFMGDEAIGIVTALQYSAALETPKNIAFVKKYRKLYGKVPSYFSETNYTTAQWIHEVMKQTSGKWPGTAAFIKRFASLTLDSIRGPLRLDEQMNPVQNVYIRKVEKNKLFGYPNEELWNTIIKTYEDVGQYWTYDKEAFLQQPVYSRDFPPCKHCE